MDTGITEANSRSGGRKHHLRLSFVVLQISLKKIAVYLWIFCCAREVFNALFECVHTPDVTNRIRSLIGWPVYRILWTRNTFIVGNCRPRFERVTENVETGTSMNGRRHGPCVQGINKTESGLQGSMCYPRLGFRRGQIKDCLE